MNLADVLQNLALGPLAELAIGGNGTGAVPAAQIPKLTFHVGTALAALYTRFPLRVRSLELVTVDGRFEYPLQARFAQSSGSTELDKFIQDSALDPFTGDVLKVTAISEAATGCELPLNRRHDERSWFSASYDTLRMGYPRSGDRYKIEYRARHAALPMQPVDPAQVAIALPAELLPALLAHVAGQVYGGMSMEGALAKSQGHYATFEGECAQHEAGNTWDQHASPQNTRFAQGGWV